jgi:hypothetical protein
MLREELEATKYELAEYKSRELIENKHTTAIEIEELRLANVCLEADKVSLEKMVTNAEKEIKDCRLQLVAKRVEQRKRMNRQIVELESAVEVVNNILGRSGNYGRVSVLLQQIVEKTNNVLRLCTS